MNALLTLKKAHMMCRVKFKLNPDFSSHENNTLDGTQRLTLIILLKNFQSCEGLSKLNPDYSSYDHVIMVALN